MPINLNYKSEIHSNEKFKLQTFSVKIIYIWPFFYTMSWVLLYIYFWIKLLSLFCLWTLCVGQFCSVCFASIRSTWLLQKPAFLSAIEDCGLQGSQTNSQCGLRTGRWNLCPIVPFETLASSLLQFPTPALCLTLDLTSLYPFRGVHGPSPLLEFVLQLQASCVYPELGLGSRQNPQAWLHTASSSYSIIC